jgi:diadenosine tetraphosphate (Ap4A) HIT family hydrolase
MDVRGSMGLPVKGENCPLCAELQSTRSENNFGLKVVDLRFSRLRLEKNQYAHGYCVLICQKHVREPFELTLAEQRLYFDDLMLAGKAIEQAFGAIKMNFEILGNGVPHLHCHILPRYQNDPSPNRPLDLSAQKVLSSPAEYTARVEIIHQYITANRPQLSA